MPRSDRPCVLGESDLQAASDAEPSLGTRDLAERVSMLDSGKSAVRAFTNIDT
ncbi:hypothetical protein KIN20_012913 [Parelaphostrongylus tenuis]|uniref:Uncharacterized protein n=1 Tax=Parelaphostrongylus tenuis TaxID=148309 RepID=A0AAD5MVD4_PARTN|nr:hypothetical protein KIN20_012913 [Parelaphostrongylus tenuis]